MNYNKHIRPNLLDETLKHKIMKTLNPPKEDYWAPTKNIFQKFYQNFIKPNIYLVIFIIIVLILLLYRYRVTKYNRNKNETFSSLQNYEINYEINPEINQTDKTNQQINYLINQTCQPDQFDQPNVSEYSEAIMNIYQQQKEKLREAAIKNKTKKNSSPNKQRLNFAYPMYPYVKGGTLTPSVRK